MSQKSKIVFDFFPDNRQKRVNYSTKCGNETTYHRPERMKSVQVSLVLPTGQTSRVNSQKLVDKAAKIVKVRL